MTRTHANTYLLYSSAGGAHFIVMDNLFVKKTLAIYLVYLCEPETMLRFSIPESVCQCHLYRVLDIWILLHHFSASWRPARNSSSAWTIFLLPYFLSSLQNNNPPQCVFKRKKYIYQRNFMFFFTRAENNQSLQLWEIIVILIQIANTIESEYGWNGNYDRNDGFSTPQIENKRRKNILFFFTRILSQD